MMNNGIKYPLKKWAELPTAQDYTGMSFYCPDTPAGASLVLSDGVRWRSFARGFFIGRKTVPASGIVTFDYTNVSFTQMLPCIQVTLSDTSGLGRLTYGVTAESLTGCSVTVRRGTVLPLVGTLTGLLGFDNFAGGNVAGVVVNLTAIPQT